MRAKTNIERRRAPVELIEKVGRGSYSRLFNDLLRVKDSIQHLERITVSNNAPTWRREALQVQAEGLQGVNTILLYDTNCYREVHYKTGTAGHRPKVYVR